MTEYKNILIEINQNVGLITLNRPKSYNALNLDLLEEVIHALDTFDRQDSVGALVITGNEKAFAAGADITTMVEASESEIRESPFIPIFSKIQLIKKPILAAVAGYCLGGGLELAMSCDIITAAENSKFGQPEINLGVIPGAGGTQRLPRSIGKSLAMEMILNNRTLSAEEALQFGLINHLYTGDDYLEKSIQLAQEIAIRAPLAIIAAKKSINNAFETTLENGLMEERELFYSLFSTHDQKEGMKSFLEKRTAKWIGS
jgi:enoyl-CoA hydratase/carnithine racemase